MKYFNTLPTTYYVNGETNNLTTLTNVMCRAEMIPELSKNPMLMYKFSIRDNDTPESLAFKYYDDQYRYWMVLYANNIMDPLADWPMSDKVFNLYLNDKYGADAATAGMPVLNYTQSTVHHYEKVITTYDSSTQSTTVKNLEIGVDDYNEVVETTNTVQLNGNVITFQISKAAISIYDYENSVNESKREINLINSSYTQRIEKQFKSLMSS